MILPISRVIRVLNESNFYECINYDLYPKIGIVYAIAKNKSEIKVTISSLNELGNILRVTIQSDKNWNRRYQFKSYFWEHDFYHSFGPVLDAITPKFIKVRFMRVNIIKYLEL
ncbi:hypothetical protein [Providencia huaxiensis]|uniref:Uncharacterized protein n=1 Tax=Providencia huaxiensis TaxID=2027290 RepID=A0A8I2DCI8_9GAMM|nr:hypothetical protein [Providencia huaxiensis]MBQ0270186.1 hypothetical protein [Providencia huaxiensis]